MKFTLDWLKAHLETDAALDDISRTLSMIGLEVEGIEDRSAAFAPFVIGYVEQASRHPDADRLQLCLVNTGTETLQVVCGAPNAHAGMKGVFAPAGTTIPGTGMKLKKASIRGQESNGMLCSEREMGLGDDHAGIIELPDDAPVGESWAAWAGLADPVIEIALTPNRGDCAGVRGIARDLAAAGLGSLKPLDASVVEGSFESPIKWRRDLPKDADACPLVVGRTFRNLTNRESPKWLRDRLTAIALRPISALVDITNWFTFDLGRPLHVFDADAVAGDLTMRFAQAGEKLAALDGRTYELEADMVVIADDDGPQGIGGVMGGAGAGCGPDTTSVFLEVALFDPIRVAATGRKLGILSDARYRFERGIDPTSAHWGAEAASRLILDLCGGEASELTVAGEEPVWRRQVSLRTSRVLSLGGVNMAGPEARRILDRLGFETRMEGETIHAAVPPWRPDIHGEADLVEEVLRIHGFDAIPAVSLARDAAIARPVRDGAQNRAEACRRALAGRGLVEAVTLSFMPRAEAELFGGAHPSLHLVNPISADLDVMRPSILPNLVAAVARNQARGIDDAALFEVGPQYGDDTPEGQALVAAGVRAGNAAARHWAANPVPVDAFHAKGDALGGLDAAGAPTANLRITRDAPGWYHPGRSGTLRLGANPLANFGELHPAVIRRMDARGPVAAFEIFLDNVPAPKAAKGAARRLLELSPLQPVHRDFAFLVAADVEAGTVVRAARGADKGLVTDVSLFDVFEGMEAGKKSLAIAVTLQPTDGTLTDDQIDAVARKIVAAVEKATGGTLRA